MRLFLQNPKEEVNLKPGEVYVVKADATASGDQRRHERRSRFLILQGVGEYDFVPLLGT